MTVLPKQLLISAENLSLWTIFIGSADGGSLGLSCSVALSSLYL